MRVEPRTRSVPLRGGPGEPGGPGPGRRPHQTWNLPAPPPRCPASGTPASECLLLEAPAHGCFVSGTRVTEPAPLLAKSRFWPGSALPRLLCASEPRCCRRTLGVSCKGGNAGKIPFSLLCRRLLASQTRFPTLLSLTHPPHMHTGHRVLDLLPGRALLPQGGTFRTLRPGHPLPCRARALLQESRGRSLDTEAGSCHLLNPQHLTGAAAKSGSVDCGGLSVEGGAASPQDWSLGWGALDTACGRSPFPGPSFPRSGLSFLPHPPSFLALRGSGQVPAGADKRHQEMLTLLEYWQLGGTRPGLPGLERRQPGLGAHP